MGKVLGPDGIATTSEAIDMKQAELTHKVIMVYLGHNFGNQCQLCACVGCRDVRERLGGNLSN